MKVAVAIAADPGKGEESLGRAFNGLALAADALRQGDEVKVLFIGAGTRWPAELSRLSHPAHVLYTSVREAVAGASAGCAVVFGAAEEVKKVGLPELTDNPLPGTPGLASLRRYLDSGWQTLVF
jgi:hypothetical protein